MASREEENTIFYSFGSMPRSHSTKKSSQSKLNPSQLKDGVAFSSSVVMLMRLQFITEKVELCFCGNTWDDFFYKACILNICVKTNITPGLIKHNVLQCNDKLEKGLI